MPPKPNDPAIVRLENVRLSFPQLFTAKAMKEGQEAKYSATFILDNQVHGALLDRLEPLIDRLALDYWKKKIRFASCLRDGNEKSDMDGYGDGVMFISTSRKTRPAVVDRLVNPVTEEDGIIYAGCYVNATIRLWVQDSHGQKRVNAELRAVQFLRDGDSFGAGNVNVEEEFDKVEDEGGSTRQRSTRPAGRSTKPSVDDF